MKLDLSLITVTCVLGCNAEDTSSGGATSEGATTGTATTDPGTDDGATTGGPEQTACEQPLPRGSDMHLEIDGVPVSHSSTSGFDYGITQIEATCTLLEYQEDLGLMELECVDSQQVSRVVEIWIARGVWDTTEPLTLRLWVGAKNEDPWPGSMYGYALELRAANQPSLVMVDAWTDGGQHTALVPEDVFDWSLDLSECPPLGAGGWACEDLVRGALTYHIPNGPTLTAYDQRNDFANGWQLDVMRAMGARLTPEAEEDPSDVCCCHGPYEETSLAFAVTQRP